MKLTPLMLFLILLFVLILSILFSKFLPLSSMSEGFISFSYDKKPIDYVSIPQYPTSSPSVLKLYDNLFFDTKNGNVIEVDGTCTSSSSSSSSTGGSITSACTVDSTGVTINGIYVAKRDGTSSTSMYVKGTNAPESSITPLSSQFNAWSYNSKSANTDKYQLFYYSWNDSTFVHIINCTQLKHLNTFLFTSGIATDNFDWTITPKPTSLINNIVATPIIGDDPANNSMVTDSVYDSTKQVYQINKNIEFDINNGNIILKSTTMVGSGGGTAISVYNRYGTPITTYNTTKVTQVPNTNFQPWMITDNTNNVLLYMPIWTKTLVTVLKINTTNPLSYTILSHSRFNSNGIDVSTSTPATTTAPAPAGTGTGDDGYQKWLAYWNTVVNANGNYSQDYLLKTQIVPPVCPSCPSCPGGGGACTNCGGLGGSGTQGAAAIGAAGAVGAVGNGDKKQFDATSKGNGNFVTTANTSTLGGATSTSALGVVSGAENIAQTGAGAVGTVVKTGADVVNKTVDKTGNVLTSAGSGATNLVGGTIGTAANLVKDAGSGTVGLIKDAGSGVKDVGSGAVGLLKDTASGVVGLAKDAGSEAKGLLKDAGSGATKVLNQGPNQRYGQGYGYYQGQNVSQGQSVGQGQNNSGWIQPGAMQQGVNGVDLYSGYGALPPKGSDFIPVTSDFSAFGK